MNNGAKPAARPQVVTGALAPAEVTHAFTLSDPTLAWLILNGIKDLENRMSRFQAGWYAVHVGKDAKTDPVAANALRGEYPDMPDVRSMPRGCVHGLCYIADAVPASDVQGRRWYVAARVHQAWATRTGHNRSRDRRSVRGVGVGRPSRPISPPQPPPPAHARAAEDPPKVPTGQA